MSNLTALLKKTTNALAGAAVWAKQNKLAEKMLVTGGVISGLGIAYMMGTAAHGVSVETNIIKTAGLQAYDAYQAAESFGLKAIVGDLSHLRTLGDLPGPLLEAIKAPFSNNMVLESWRGIGTSVAGTAGMAMGLITKFALRNAPAPKTISDLAPPPPQPPAHSAPAAIAPATPIERLRAASAQIPQLAAALTRNADITVLDRMLQSAHNNIELAEIYDEPVPSLAESFNQVEQMHGGFRDFYQSVQQNVRHQEVYASLTKIRAIIADVDQAAEIHFQPNLRKLAGAEPAVATRLDDLVKAVDALRASAGQCKNLAPEVRAEIATIEDSAHLHTAEIRHSMAHGNELKFG